MVVGLVLVAVSCGLMVYVFWPSQSGSDIYASVYVSAKIVKIEDKEEIDLTKVTEEKSYELQGKETTFTVTVRKGEIGITHSGCANQFCVNQGFISRTSQTLICAPNEVVITLKGNNSGEIEI